MVQAQPGWVAGDFHQHTTYTDGKNPFATVMYYNNYFGLDWWANSEHGGVRSTDAFGPILELEDPDMNTGVFARFWDDPSVYPAGTILGDIKMSGGHQQMWRWQSLRDFSFGDVLAARESYPHRTIIQGVEWNIPGHEHCSIGILNSQFRRGNPNVDLLAAFDYLFDASDTDTTGGKAQGWEALTYNGVKNKVNNHTKAVEAASFLHKYAPRTSWMVPTHVERAKLYKISDFRDLNNAAPTVCFGFDSMPGHQKESGRGGYGTGADGGGTYGGCGVYAAKVGGLWDALLGEGRGWWLFASSDFHSTGVDFWPGEYQKTYTYVTDRHDPQAIVDGLRSGNSYVVEGDLIDGLTFKVSSRQGVATMGQTLRLDAKKRHETDKQVTLTIRFRSPRANNHGDPVAVDHIDLIAGKISGLVPVGSSSYSTAINPSAQVIARFTPADWEEDEEENAEDHDEDCGGSDGPGWNVIKYRTTVHQDMYFRLRGTNNALTSPEIDPSSVNGDPALDPQGNTEEAAWADLWFYSNPIFVRVR